MTRSKKPWPESVPAGPECHPLPDIYLSRRVWRIMSRMRHAEELDHLPWPVSGASCSGPGDLAGALRAAKNGDEDAFRTLNREIQPRLLRYVRTLVGDEAEDVTSEAWLRIAKDIAVFDGDIGGFRAGTAAVARRRAVGHRRGRGRRPGGGAPRRGGRGRPAADDAGRTARGARAT